MRVPLDRKELRMIAKRRWKTQMSCLLASAWLWSGSAHATWSIIVLDPDTRAIGLAGASCSDYVAGIAGFVPGKGAVMAQAASNWAAKTKAEELIGQGVTPEKILAVITDPSFDSKFARQQYAIMTFDAYDAPANFTGAETPGDRGSLTGPGFSVQGNTLVSSAVLEAAARAIAEERVAKRPLAEILLAALTAGADAGGDNRCGDQRATSAFISVIHSDLPFWIPYLSLNVHNLERGKANAVVLLASEYRRWKARYSKNRSTSWSVSPPRR
jgi:uncharacterized Ntn-hydrolase superfamily protein